MDDSRIKNQHSSEHRMLSAVLKQVMENKILLYQGVFIYKNKRI